MIQPTDLVNSLPAMTAFPGTGTLERQRGRPYRARLGSNEGLFGTSPLALKAAAAARDSVRYYNDPKCFDLITALCAQGGFDPAHVLVDVGIDGLLGLFLRGFLDPGAIAITTRGSYPTFNAQLTGHGGCLAEVSYTARYACDLDAMRDAARVHRARVCYLANPDNPTGTFHPKEDLARFIDALPEDCLLLLDEAYLEFAPDDLRLPDDFTRPNLIRLRTFSKAYGLAGARVGYAVCDPGIVEAMNRIRLQFGVATLSQSMARAALEDQTFLAGVVAATAEGRYHMESIARGMPVRCLPSHANFVALEFETPAQAMAAAAVMEEFDVFVRRPPEPGVDRLMRVTIGPKPVRDLFADAWQEVLRRA